MEIAKTTKKPEPWYPKPVKPGFPELRKWLKETGQRQYDLARILGLSPSRTSRYLNGFQDITADRAIKLSLLSGIAPELLVGDPETARTLKFLGRRTRRRGRNAT